MAVGWERRVGSRRWELMREATTSRAMLSEMGSGEDAQARRHEESSSHGNHYHETLRTRSEPVLEKTAFLRALGVSVVRVYLRFFLRAFASSREASLSEGSGRGWFPRFLHALSEGREAGICRVAR